MQSTDIDFNTIVQQRLSSMKQRRRYARIQKKELRARIATETKVIDDAQSLKRKLLSRVKVVDAERVKDEYLFMKTIQKMLRPNPKIDMAVWLDPNYHSVECNLVKLDAFDSATWTYVDTFEGSALTFTNPAIQNFWDNVSHMFTVKVDIAHYKFSLILAPSGEKIGWVVKYRQNGTDFGLIPGFSDEGDAVARFTVKKLNPQSELDGPNFKVDSNTNTTGVLTYHVITLHLR